MKLLSDNRAIALGIILSLAVNTPALADDIELYRGSSLGQDATMPNVLFVVDTSGSMNETVETQDVYDPGIDYTARSFGCPIFKDRIYWSTGTADTSCTNPRSIHSMPVW